MNQFTYAKLELLQVHGSWHFFLDGERVTRTYELLSLVEVMKVLGKDGWQLVTEDSTDCWVLMKTKAEAESKAKGLDLKAKSFYSYINRELEDLLDEEAALAEKGVTSGEYTLVADKREHIEEIMYVFEEIYGLRL